ncbi:MAG: hypothetical protein CFE25_02505 [Chitinophagaceae bacterium BSSC1]|nr:MAG: hypothetical protein CFE25_02505 [Chitinophagaceae bacterium BSSC1]
METALLLTADGSHTLVDPTTGASYHSKHGAIGESQEVFIQAGLEQALKRNPNQMLRVFEMGFGTGLNALLTLQKATEWKVPIAYTAIELHPIPAMHYQALNYGEQLGLEVAFQTLHDSPWNQVNTINEWFSLRKVQNTLLDYQTDQTFHAIYFDAFHPELQPELWTQTVFEQCFQMLAPNGLLTTYCSKSIVRKNMMAAGLQVEKIPGPWGKREMVRANKPV